jgi:cation diffusion facilitator family transporter
MAPCVIVQIEHAESVARSAGSEDQRYAAVSRVLIRVLVLNLVVAVAKIVFGYLSGAISILSDGFHSLTDTVSNVVGLAGVQAARKPPDREHPYGHRKYETVAAASIVIFLIIVVAEIVRSAVGRFSRGGQANITLASFVVMVGTMAINLFVVRYERRAGHDLSSEVLIADAMHTRSDVLTSLTVIVALAGARAGLPILDAVAALVVAVFILYAGYEIARDALRILSDRIVIEEDDLHQVVMSVPSVLGCHHIRTRGAVDHVFLDLHIWLDGATRLDEAHRVSHVVKDRLMAKYPQIVDAIIHIEPPPPEPATR